MVGTEAEKHDVVRSGRTARKYSRAKRSSSDDARAFISSATTKSSFVMYAVNEDDGSARNVSWSLLLSRFVLFRLGVKEEEGPILCV